MESVKRYQNQAYIKTTVNWQLGNGISRLGNISTVGINCIEPHLVTEAIRKLKKYSTKKVLIYPNSGELYNSNTKEWTGQKKLSKTHIKEWLKLSPDIIGGCCRVGTDIIKEINNQINI